MKITLDKTLVEMLPETPEEAKALDTLWKAVIDCVNTNKKLVPIGEYILGEKELARFNIET